MSRALLAPGSGGNARGTPSADALRERPPASMHARTTSRSRAAARAPAGAPPSGVAGASREAASAIDRTTPLRASPIEAAAPNVSPTAHVLAGLFPLVVVLVIAVILIVRRRNSKRHKAEVIEAAKQYEAAYNSNGPISGGAAPAHTASTASAVSGAAAHVATLHGDPQMVMRHLRVLAKEDFVLDGRYTLERPSDIAVQHTGVMVHLSHAQGSSALGASPKLQSCDSPFAVSRPAAATPAQLTAVFHTDRAAFERERAFMQDPQTAHLRPAFVEALPPRGAAPVQARWQPLPPCIVTEAGESAREWFARCENSGVQAAAGALRTMAQLLAQVHAEGWVHGNVRPESFRRLHSTQAFALVNFGHTAHAGDTVGIQDQGAAYLAPECAASHDSGADKCAASAAADMWAFGVTAWQLLYNTAAFSDATRADVAAALRSGASLPWEKGAPRGAAGAAPSPAALRLHGIVLECLRRDPAERPAAHALAQVLGVSADERL